MKIPAITGTIKRRILVNYRIDPRVMQRLLPSRFRPKLQADYAMAGICLIRLEHIRPRGFPEIIGLSSENAAHRVAVLWNDELGNVQEGVFIQRRDSDSMINHLTGGRIFPGHHCQASFTNQESETNIHLNMKSTDGKVALEVDGAITDRLPRNSIFESVFDASAFFEAGSLGYSVTGEANRLDGLTLKTKCWHVEPLNITKVMSTYFADESLFPRGSAEFDHALLMRNIQHEWHAAPDLYL